MYFFSLILEAHSPDLQRNHFCQDDSHKKRETKREKTFLSLFVGYSWRAKVKTQLQWPQLESLGRPFEKLSEWSMTEVNYHLADLSEAALQGERHTPPTSDYPSTTADTSPARQENTGHRVHDRKPLHYDYLHMLLQWWNPTYIYSYIGTALNRMYWKKPFSTILHDFN